MSDKTPEFGTIMKHALAYEEAVEKGQRLLALTIADITDSPPQSKFQDIDDLEVWGWCTFTLASPSPTPATNLVRALCPTLKSSPTTAGILTNHDETVTVDGKTYPATMAHFHSVIEPEAGILLAECNTTPEAMLNPYRNLDPATLVAKLPELRHWSDVAFLQWKNVCTNFRSRYNMPELRLVVRYQVLNANTRAICSIILASLRKQRQETAKPGISYDSWLPRWPGIAFPIESEEAIALCGTPNGSGVLHLLAQHKAKLGHKTIQEVCLYYEDEDDKGLREVPTLIFHVQDV